MEKIRAIVLFSGGLDSILAARILMKEGIDIIPVTFRSPFVSIEHAVRLSEKFLHKPTVVVDISEDMLNVVKRPRYGYGKQMNPCVDCRILTFKLAGSVMKGFGALFMATGEVVGERPFTQNRDTLILTAKNSGYDGYILRPLSAKLLPPTIPEERGWVSRERLFAIQGRSRKEQFRLAQDIGVDEYPSPAGGCILTDPSFAKRMRHIMSYLGDVGLFEIELLKLGRHFTFGRKNWLVVGRNKEENKRLLELSMGKQVLVLQVNGYAGPIGLFVSERWDRCSTYLSSNIVSSYSDAPVGMSVGVSVKGEETYVIAVFTRKKERFRRYMVVV